MYSHTTYQLFQAERRRTAAETRSADERLGEMARTAQRIGRRVTLPARALAVRARRGARPGPSRVRTAGAR